VSTVETIMSHIITMTMPPPTHQPVVAAMIGLSVLKPTLGMQRHSSGRSETSAPEQKVRSPTLLRMATRWLDASKAWKACCSSTATAALIALRRSGRLMRMIETGPFSSMVTTGMEAFPHMLETSYALAAKRPCPGCKRRIMLQPS
jgi:hypothetical protein